MEVLPKKLDRRPLVLSYTLLNTYADICPHQAAERYIYRNVPFFETDQMREGTAVHKAMENRISKKVPLPERFKRHEKFAAPMDHLPAPPKCEQMLGVTKEGTPEDFFGKSVFLRGKLDCPIVNRHKAHLFDWKNGKVRESPFELEVQAVLLKAKYPQLEEIKGQYGWLAQGRMGQVHDLSDVASTWNVIRQIASEIAADRQKGVFEKRKGPLCAWCPCKDCEEHPEYGS